MNEAITDNLLIKLRKRLAAQGCIIDLFPAPREDGI